MNYTLELQIAITAVQQAARLCEQVRQEIVPIALEKNDCSPVTVADFGAQAIVGRALQLSFPEDVLIAEEDSALLRDPAQASVLSQVTAFVEKALYRPGAASLVRDWPVLDWIDQGKNEGKDHDLDYELDEDIDDELYDQLYEELEKGIENRSTDRFWTLDPIDGTKGFLRGDQYAIALALIEQGEVKLGILGCPALTLGEHTGILFVALRGQGARMIPIAQDPPDLESATRLQVVQSGENDRVRFVESVESAHGDQTLQETIARSVGITSPSIRMDSQAKYGAVAAGEAALYLRLPSPKTPDYREQIWDHAAGVIVIEEAGGRVTDMHGHALDFSLGKTLANNQGIVASNGAIHDRVLQALIRPD